ncbi:hypothetical protein ACYOEI_04175 [Singulisphaera rosea]
MVTDRQFRRLRKLIQTESTLANAADRADIDEKTARKYRDSDLLPSQRRVCLGTKLGMAHSAARRV